MTDPDAWALDFVDDDVDLPGWIYIPAGMDAVEQDSWLTEVTNALVDVPTWDGQPLDEPEIRAVLREGLDQRAASSSLAMLQVWPTLGGIAATCYVDIVLSDVLPVWADTDAVVHPAESPSLGPGLQCTTRQSMDLDGTEVDLTGVSFVFDNGEVSVVVGLAETVSALVAPTLPGLVVFLSNLRVLRADGTPFRAIAPPGVDDDAAWDIEETA